MSKIRSWLKRAEDCRREFVEVEEREPRDEERRARAAIDARHGLAPFAGREVQER